MHRCPTFVSAARLPSTSLTYIRTRCTSTVYIATYARTRRRTSLLFTAVLHSYALLVCRLHRDLRSFALQNLVGMHLCPTFVSAARLPSTSRPPFVRVAEPRWYALLSYIHKRCSSGVYIADLRSYALQNLVGIHHCPTFVRAARLPSTSPTSVRTHCRTSLVRTAVLHS